jgi:hypothetical protein
MKKPAKNLGQRGIVANISGYCSLTRVFSCHHNVSMWCQHEPDFEPVRGWLYFDLPGLNYVKFVAHSAVRTPEGELFDITPSRAFQDYLFIEGGLSEEEYAHLVETQGVGEIHAPKENA